MSEQDLANRYLRAILEDLILCHADIDREDLIKWERILKGPDERAFTITKDLLAIAEGKLRASEGTSQTRPENVVGFLLYHYTHFPYSHIPEDLPPGDKSCQKPGCGRRFNSARQGAVMDRIRRGFRLRDLRNLEDVNDLLDTHLNQAQINRFVGHKINFYNQEQYIKEIREEIERDFSRWG